MFWALIPICSCASCLTLILFQACPRILLLTRLLSLTWMPRQICRVRRWSSRCSVTRTLLVAFAFSLVLSRQFPVYFMYFPFQYSFWEITDCEYVRQYYFIWDVIQISVLVFYFCHIYFLLLLFLVLFSCSCYIYTAWLDVVRSFTGTYQFLVPYVWFTSYGSQLRVVSPCLGRRAGCGAWHVKAVANTGLNCKTSKNNIPPDLTSLT